MAINTPPNVPPPPEGYSYAIMTQPNGVQTQVMLPISALQGVPTPLPQTTLPPPVIPPTTTFPPTTTPSMIPPESKSPSGVGGNQEMKQKKEEEEEEEKEKVSLDHDISESVERFRQLAIDSKKKQRDMLRVKQQDPSSHLYSVKSFDELELPPSILEAIQLDFRFERPSEIQEKALPLICNGDNLIAQAQAGSGKTIAFVIGMLRRVDVSSPHTQALCIAPTREIAVQICGEVVEVMARRMEGLTFRTLLAKDRMNRRDVLSEHVIVGTPGKIENAVRDGNINTDHLKVFVLDEADELVNDNFRELTFKIFKGISSRESVQRLLFSATYPERLHKASKYIAHPSSVILLPSKEATMLDQVAQLYIETGRIEGGKLALLRDIYSFLEVQQTIVFLDTKRAVRETCQTLQSEGFSVSQLHGDMTGEERDKAMADFRKAESKVLIASNVLSRGVDLPDVKVVINYELPYTYQTNEPDCESYVHRIGRTGRFGSVGLAINFVHTQKDRDALRVIEEFYSPHKPLIKRWEAEDVEGLVDLLEERTKAAYEKLNEGDEEEDDDDDEEEEEEAKEEEAKK